MNILGLFQLERDAEEDLTKVSLFQSTIKPSLSGGFLRVWGNTAQKNQKTLNNFQKALEGFINTLQTSVSTYESTKRVRQLTSQEIEEQINFQQLLDQALDVQGAVRAWLEIARKEDSQFAPKIFN